MILDDTKDHSDDDKISLKELIIKIKASTDFLLSKWKIILVAGCLGGLLGLCYSILDTPNYIAETTFVLEDGEGGGGLGQYAGIASMVGLDLGGGEGIFQGDNILELYKSRKMIEATLLSEGIFNDKSQLLIDRYIEFNKLKDKWLGKPELINLKFSSLKHGKDRLRDSLMGKIVDDVNKNILNVSRPDNKLSIIKVSVNSIDELFAKYFAETIVNKVNQFYIDTKTKKSQENVTILQIQTDSVRRVLNNSIGGVAMEIDANPNSNPAFQRLRIGSQKKQVDVQAAGAVYEELVKNLELSKINLRKERPLIQVIDEPVLPLKVQKTGKIKATIVGGVSFGILIVVLLLVFRFIKDIL